jgi:RimJ/RimL family protein N-acetyltransferase
MDNKILTLRPVEDTDIERLKIWFNKDYILQWYNDADQWLDEVKGRNGNFSFVHHFIVYKANEPIGFCQYYDCFDAKEDWYEVATRNRIFSIDYLIGEEKYLRKGYGKVIVQILIDTIRKTNQTFEIVVQPDLENIPLNRVLLANGFIYDEEKKYYVIKIS